MKDSLLCLYQISLVEEMSFASPSNLLFFFFDICSFIIIQAKANAYKFINFVFKIAVNLMQYIVGQRKLDRVL